MTLERITFGLFLLFASLTKAQLTSHCRPASVAPCLEADNRVTEIPVGAIDGNNLRFRLNTTINDQSELHLYINGLDLTTSAGLKVAGNAITITKGLAPKPGDIVRASYRPSEERSSRVISRDTSASTAHQDALIRTVLLQSIRESTFANHSIQSPVQAPIVPSLAATQDSRSVRRFRHSSRDIDADFSLLTNRMADHSRKLREGQSKRPSTLTGEDTASEGLGDLPISSPYTALLEGRRGLVTPFSNSATTKRSLGGQQALRSIKMLEQRLSTPDHN